MRMARRIFGSTSGRLTENDFTYTGSYEWTDEDASNWHLEFKGNGTLTLKKSVRADLYLLGGGQGGYQSSHWGGGYHEDNYYAGGAGGQGGFIQRVYNLIILPGTYNIVIGPGGNNGNGLAGGATTFLEYTAPGGGSGATGYEGGAAGGAAGYGRGTNTPVEGGSGANSSVYDFCGLNRGGGGSGGYSWKQPWTSGSASYNFVAATGGQLGGGRAMTARTGGPAINPTSNYGGGGYGGSNGGGYYGGSGSVQIRNAR